MASHENISLYLSIFFKKFLKTNFHFSILKIINLLKYYRFKYSGRPPIFCFFIIAKKCRWKKAWKKDCFLPCRILWVIKDPSHLSGSRLVIHVPQTINVKRAPNKLLDTACYSPIEPYGFQAMKCKKIDSNYSRKYDKIRTFWIFIIASKSYGSVGLWQAVSKSLLGALFTFIVWGTWMTNLEPLKWDGSLMT